KLLLVFADTQDSRIAAADLPGLKNKWDADVNTGANPPLNASVASYYRETSWQTQSVTAEIYPDVTHLDNTVDHWLGNNCTPEAGAHLWCLPDDTRALELWANAVRPIPGTKLAQYSGVIVLLNESANKEINPEASLGASVRVNRDGVNISLSIAAIGAR